MVVARHKLELHRAPKGVCKRSTLALDEIEPGYDRVAEAFALLSVEVRE